MRYRKLGNTDLSVSEIGFGTIPILSGNVPILPEFYSPDLETAISIMREAYEMGCNLFDTAIPAEYGDAEYKLGRFVDSVPRESIIIADKARKYTGEEIKRAVYQSCENLGTFPDIYFIHQVEEKNIPVVFSSGGALEALWQLKQEKVIRYVGIASHYYNVLKRAADDPRVDVLQGSGNILECGILNRLAENHIIQKKGFFLNKVYAAGLLTKTFSPQELIGGILHYPVSSALIGIGNCEQAEVAMGREHTCFDISFDEVFNTVNREHDLIACDRCQKCVCRYHHEIHSVFRYYNYYCLGLKEWAMIHLGIRIKKMYAHCCICQDRKCLQSCPRHLPISLLVENICEKTGLKHDRRKTVF